MHGALPLGLHLRGAGFVRCRPGCGQICPQPRRQIGQGCIGMDRMLGRAADRAGRARFEMQAKGPCHVGRGTVGLSRRGDKRRNLRLGPGRRVHRGRNGCGCEGRPCQSVLFFGCCQGLIALGCGMVLPRAVQPAKGSSQIRQLARCLHRVL